MLEWLGYFEEIKTLTYREQDGITIPKSVRERAFSLQVDVEIVSTNGNDYLNFKSAPAYGFYGYAVLVFRDHCDIQIPINQPRQRLYYGRVAEAYVNWYELFNLRVARQRLNEIVVALGSIWGALGLEDFPLEAAPCPLWSGFEELPLREVYIKTRFGTQFKIEVSHWYPIIRTGDEDGCNYDGKSQQSDGDKDNGLPENGSQPQVANDPNNPYANLPAPSLPSEELGFSNSKISNINDKNPDNNPTGDNPATPTTEGWYWRISWVSAQSASVCNARLVKFYKSAPRTANFSYEVLGDVGSPCVGHLAGQFTIEDPVSSFVFTRGYASEAGASFGERLYGLLPVPDGSFE